MYREDSPHGYLEKGVTVSRMRELLGELPDDAILTPNAVGNIALLDPDWQQFGYIDLGNESVELPDQRATPEDADDG